MSAVPRLHVITDENVQSRFSHLELALLAAKGGAGAVQLREKRPTSTKALIELATAAREAVQGSNARIVVNDRIDVAAAAGVDAVHLGRDDPPPELARRLLGTQALVGATANSLEEAKAVDLLPIDYIGIGPVFGTQTKDRPAPALGLPMLGEIARAVQHPLIAIGNISAERVADVLDSGAWGVAVVSAIVATTDPERATRAFRDAIDRFEENHDVR
jgi:thiamine-phosphate pyrophosphorylase